MLETNETEPTIDEVLPLTTIESKAPVSVDVVEGGAKLSKETAVYEIHIRKPGFVKPIPPAHFIRKIKEAGEQTLTAEQEILLKQYQASITQTEGENGQRTDTTMLHISQDILDRREIAKIVNHDDKFTAWLKANSIPSPVKLQGTYLFRLSQCEEIEKSVELFDYQRKILIEAFKNKYLELKEQAKSRRWPFYDENDYPEWHQIEVRYGVEGRWMSFNVPAALENLNSAIYEREKEKNASKWASAFEEGMAAQRLAFTGLLEHFTEMLGKDETTGKRKSFRPTAVKKFQSFLTTFQQINLYGDAELETLINQSKQVLEGVDPETLKKDVSLRDVMETSFKKIKESTSEMVSIRKRKVVFEDAAQEDVLPMES